MKVVDYRFERSPLRRLLIANRGEIAVRIIRACREAGVSPVVVCSEADRNALHVVLADAACCIGPAPAVESYLKIDRIVEAAQRMDADAIHPGYGFLSENADFAQSCEEAGLTFVGPPASVMRLLGDKIAARQLVAGSVPLVPGYSDDDQSAIRLRTEAERIGTPLLIKAASGGGGRGMRVVEDLSDLTTALDEARREAKAAFGDDRVFLERYVVRPRHIEFQIFGDKHGNLIHLYERECSIQRRHQKIIEESPSPALSPDLRNRMAEAALTVGKMAGYTNAGTVEFLLETRPDGDHAFYFLEVNTRLQVEHPVTEAVTGLDLVRLQLRIADGERLPYSQQDVSLRGHAIETRIYAEDPSSGFAPSIGKLAHWIEPTGPGVRIDSGVEQDSDVTPYYDPMLAKLIVQAETRTAALSRLELALSKTAVLGIQSNIPYLLAIVKHPAFQSGDLSTGFLREHFADWKQIDPLPHELRIALAAVSNLKDDGSIGNSVEVGAQRKIPELLAPWVTAEKWRNT